MVIGAHSNLVRNQQNETKQNDFLTSFRATSTHFKPIPFAYINRTQSIPIYGYFKQTASATDLIACYSYVCVFHSSSWKINKTNSQSPINLHTSQFSWIHFDKFIDFHCFIFVSSFRNGILVYGIYTDCEHPPTILHGKAELLINEDGTEVSASYSCDSGFHLHGKSQMSCDTNEDVWLGDLPACKLGKSHIYG